MARRYKEKQKSYYLRMQLSDVWYFLLRVSHDKKCHCMKPVWWPERMQGASRPYLFKTLVGARNAQENYVAVGARSEIKEWSENHARLSNKSA